jgi:hypothetical protein
MTQIDSLLSGLPSDPASNAKANMLVPGLVILGVVFTPAILALLASFLIN